MSLSSSSPSSAIFTDKFYTHRAPGFFSGVVRRILCSGGLPTYPFDKIKESELELSEEIYPYITTLEKIADSGSPNLVARLMGLNSKPEMGFGETRKARDSLSRSKSMNSTDLRSEELRIQDRILKKSRSLREMPVSFEIENDEFLVLTFDTELGSIEANQRKKGERNRAKPRKQRSCFEEEEDDEERVCVEAESPSSGSGSSSMEIRSQRDCGEMRSRRMRRRRRKHRGKCDGERESVSANSSPVSVLDLTEFAIDHDVSTPEEDSRPRVSLNTFSIRNLTVEILDDEFPSDYTNSISNQANDVQPSADDRRTHSPAKFNSITRGHYSLDMLSKIYRLAEDDVLQSNSTHTKRKVAVNGGIDWEGVGAEIGSYIFDQLIDDVVAELVCT